MLQKRKPKRPPNELKMAQLSQQKSHSKSTKSPKARKALKSVSQLKKEADKYHSIYIRMRDADHRGVVTCITCPVQKHWKQIQCGHFVKRSVSLLRYDEENTNAQCVSCNMFKNGEQYAYSLALDKKYGDGTAERLWEQRFTTHSFTREELLSIIHDRKEQIAEFSNAQN